MADMTQTQSNRPDVASRQGRKWRRRSVAALMCVFLIGMWLVIQRLVLQPSVDSITTAMREGHEDLATQMTEQYVTQNPNDVEGWLLQAELAELAEDYRKASTAYAVVVSLQPDQLRHRHRLVKAQLQSAQFEAAETNYREILERSPLDEIAQTEIQWMLFHQQRVRELEDFLERCLADDPASSRLLFHLLMISQKPPNPLESLPVLEKIDAACPGQSTILAGLARCAWRTGDLPRARELFARLQHESKSLRELVLTLAEFELEQSNVDAADQLLRSQDNNSSIDWSTEDRWWWLQSQIFQHRRQYATALESITEACRLRPRESQYLQSRLTLLQILGRGDEAAIVQADLESRRTAIEAIYQIVNRGDLNQQSENVLGEIARHCRTLRKLEQADGWDQLRLTR